MSQNYVALLRIVLIFEVLASLKGHINIGFYLYYNQLFYFTFFHLLVIG